MNSYDNYQLLHEILLINEATTSAVIKKGFKQIGRNLKKDPLSATLMAIPAPPPIPTQSIGLGLHLYRSPSSRKILKTTGAKILNPNRPKAGVRKALELEKQRKRDFSKYLSLSKAVA